VEERWRDREGEGHGHRRRPEQVGGSVGGSLDLRSARWVGSMELAAAERAERDCVGDGRRAWVGFGPANIGL
jgi:hypothetical protein